MNLLSDEKIAFSLLGNHGEHGVELTNQQTYGSELTVIMVGIREAHNGLAI